MIEKWEIDRNSQGNLSFRLINILNCVVLILLACKAHAIVLSSTYLTHKKVLLN